MIFYEIAPVRTEYVAREDVELRLRITNQGATPIRVADPTVGSNSEPRFSVVGPGYATAHEFSNWSAKATDPTLPAPPLTEMLLSPSQVWSGGLLLSAQLPLQGGGEYLVRSSIPVQGSRVQSTDCRFRVHRVRPSSLHLGLGTRPNEEGIGRIVLLQKGTGSSTLYAARFQEVSGGHGEVEISSLVRRADVSLDAVDVASPWRNTQVFDEAMSWIVWREHRFVKAVNEFAAVAAIELPVEPAYLVRPPLKTRGGPAEVLVVSADGKRLMMVSIPHSSPATPKVAWETALPAAPASPSAIVAALGPADQGSIRHIVLAVERDGGLDVFHTQYRQDASPDPFEAMHVGARAMPVGVPLSMLVTADGVAHVALLASANDLALVEIAFPKGAPSSSVRHIGFPDAPLTAAAVLCSDRAGIIARCDVVLVVQGGSVRKLDGMGRLSPVESPGQPIVPLQLTPGNAETFVLFADPTGGLFFAPI